MQPCNLLKPLPQSSRYSKNVYQGMHNEKCNKSSFYLPLLFNFYLLSYAFLLAKKKNVKGKNMKKSIDKWLSWSVLSGVVATWQAMQGWKLFMYTSLKGLLGVPRVFFSHNASPLIVNRWKSYYSHFEGKETKTQRG